MNTHVRGVAMAVGSVVAALTFWACTATRESNGAIRIEFAPDMVVRAFGYEEALRRCQDLHRDCLNGAFSRPCTPEEIEDILRATRIIARHKNRTILPTAL